ncbi:MAG: choice-of-anchor Q domain-containing protein [Rhodanobacteraceae bacterium]
MGNQHLESRCLGRRTALARGLAMAMALGMGGAAAAAPADLHTTPQLADPQTTLIRGAVSGTAQHHSAPAPHAARSTAATITVSNCNNSGSGSLRDAIGSAASGDTIDLSGLPDCDINLSSSIVTSVDDLTLLGKTDSKYPIVSGQNNITPLVHTGTGTLTLDSLAVEHGYFSSSGPFGRGGCLFSSGDVVLENNSFLGDCEVRTTSSGTAQGGGVFAYGSVTLDGSTVLASGAHATSDGGAQGGGIHSSAGVVVDNSSIVLSNKALTDGAGSAQGGGIWSQNGTIIRNQSTVDSNTAQSYGSGSAIGGGIYATGDLTVQSASSVNDNNATAVSAFVSGGGAQTGGAATIKYAVFDGNLAESGSSSAQGGGLRTDHGLATKYTTISNNEARSSTGESFGGGIISRGDASVRLTTISGNTAQVVGGLDLLGPNATQALVINSSTVSGNTATDSRFGAGIYAGYDTEIKNSTVTGNIESNPADKKYGAGLSVKHDVNVDLSSTIISDNKIAKSDSSSPDSDIDAANSGSNATLSGDHNLIGISGLTYPGDTIVTGAPGLGPLQDNGGLTWTHAVLPGSDAIDTGVSNGFTTDQRGTGYARTVGVSPDIGAYEMGGDTIFANGFENP